MREVIRLNRPELWANHFWFLHRQIFDTYRSSSTVFAWFGSVWTRAISKTQETTPGKAF